MPLLNKFWGSRVNNGDATENVAKKMYVDILLKINFLEISRDIFFKTKGCSGTIKRPYLYGKSFGALESIMATLLKCYHCGRFQVCTLQMAPKLAAESRQLIEANAIHRSLKTAHLDENNAVAGSLGYYTQLCSNDVSLMIY